MNLRAIVAVGAAFLCLTMPAPASASAHTTISCTSGCSAPYQQWVDEAEVNTPEAVISVTETTTPCGFTETLGCAFISAAGAAEIQVQTQPSGTHAVFMHELGHIWDFTTMRPWQRAQFLRIVGDRPTEPWGEGEEVARMPREVFAESYSACARFGDRVKRGDWYEINPWEFGGRRLARICRLIG